MAYPIDIQKLKNLMAARGLTQKSLSEKSGLTEQGVSYIMKNGAAAMPSIVKIAAVLGIKPELIQMKAQPESTVAQANDEWKAMAVRLVEQNGKLLNMLDERDKLIFELQGSNSQKQGASRKGA